MGFHFYLSLGPPPHFLTRKGPLRGVEGRDEVRLLSDHSWAEGSRRGSVQVWLIEQHNVPRLMGRESGFLLIDGQIWLGVQGRDHGSHVPGPGQGFKGQQPQGGLAPHHVDCFGLPQEGVRRTEEK